MSKYINVVDIKSCAYCYDGVHIKDCLQCSICRQWIEYLCANIHPAAFVNMSIKQKSTWKCFSCKSKQLKDDSTSPRSLPPAGTSAPVRANPQSYTPAQVHDNTLVQISRATLREMIKQEIQSALKDSETNQFKLVAGFKESLSSYNKKQEEMMAMLKDRSDRIQKLEKDNCEIRDAVAGLKESLSSYNIKYEEEKAMLKDKSDRIQKLEKENCELRDAIEQLSRRLNLVEQNLSSAHVELQCVPENEAKSRATTVLLPDKTQLSGYLLRKFKKSPGWQKLWVVFAVSTLFFYKSWQDETPLASLPLLGYSVAEPTAEDNIDKDFVFKLQFKNHVYFFRADSQYTFIRWTEVLRTATMRPELD